MPSVDLIPNVATEKSAVHCRAAVGYCALLLFPLTGCVSVGGRGPADSNVIEARQLTQRGIDAACHGDWGQAEMLLAQASQSCPSDVPAKEHYARMLWRRGKRDKAIEVMADAVRLSGSDPRLHVELGKLYLAEGDLARASWHADVAVGGNQQSAEAWALRGDVLDRKQDASAALAAYHRALGLQGDFSRVQLAVADLYQRLNRPRRSLATLDHLAQRYPDDQVPPHVHYRQGVALLALQRFEDAADHLAIAAEHETGSAEVFYQLGRAELLAGRPTSARWAVSQALTWAPAHGPARHLLAEIDDAQRRMAATAEIPRGWE
jgi:Flp pilus assembly protein TadD